jgi:hypothetical protein
MIDIGEAIDLDVYIEDKYEYTPVLSDDAKQKIRDNIYKLASEHIYKYSKIASRACLANNNK